ncbi:MAG: TonB-dependent hemoglobin/transferrin/lactoferrin family receptor, partial [Pseudomonadota bacterium]|nr:TonB-dependent hemoglobin/transferrin/lactoferrin family receptor [Pseudomonadota bacterium]
MSICAVSPKRLALCIASALVSSVSVAEAIPGDAAFETITISATRSERDINEITSHVSVIDSEQSDAQVMTDIRDLVRYEPGVSVEGG